MLIDCHAPHPCPSCQSQAQIVLARVDPALIVSPVHLSKDREHLRIMCCACRLTYTEEVTGNMNKPTSEQAAHAGSILSAAMVTLYDLFLLPPRLRLATREVLLDMCADEYLCMLGGHIQQMNEMTEQIDACEPAQRDILESRLAEMASNLNATTADLLGKMLSKHYAAIDLPDDAVTH